MRKVATVKYAFIKSKHFFCLLFSWRDGSIFVSISLEIHSSQVWSKSICFSNMFTPQTNTGTRTSKQPTHKHTKNTTHDFSAPPLLQESFTQPSQTAKTLAKKRHDKDFEKNHTLNKSIPTFLTAQTPKPHICNATTGRFTIPWVFVTSGCHFI